DAERHFLYIVEPGIRNYVSYGGVGILVYDIDQGYKFVRRIPTWSVPTGQEPDNVKGVAANAKTGQIYVSTTKRLAAFDLATDKMVWDVAPEGGCDRPSVSHDGSILYVPSFEGPHWNVVDTKTGATIKKIVLNSRAHNTLFSDVIATGGHPRRPAPLLAFGIETQLEVARRSGALDDG